jgi:uncharacterized membrane protein (DUF2068 family)
VNSQAPIGERLIVAYKFGKAALEAGAAVTLWLAVTAGVAGRVVDAAIAVGVHSVHPLAVRLAHWLSVAATTSHLHVLALLLGADALVSAAEGWVLRQRYPWGRWLVVLATAALLPIELYEFIHRPRITRAVLFIINAVIVLYLAAGARRRPGKIGQHP